MRVTRTGRFGDDSSHDTVAGSRAACEVMSAAGASAARLVEGTRGIPSMPAWSKRYSSPFAGWLDGGFGAATPRGVRPQIRRASSRSASISGIKASVHAECCGSTREAWQKRSISFAPARTVCRACST
jgi:hypothetical protein